MIARGLQFGTVLPSFDATLPRRAASLEEQGWDVLAAGEHVSFNMPGGNAFVSLAAAAAATQRVRLLSSVTLLPLYPAALAAKMAAALDNVSGGRFMLGVGAGGESPKEFAACGVDVATRGRRADEALTVMRRLWTEESVTHAGEFAHFDDVAIAPRPVQDGGVPIWVAGRKEAAMRRAARHGDGWLPYMYSPEQLAHSIATIAQQRPADRPAIVPGVFLWGCVHRDHDTAVAYAIEKLGRAYKQDFHRMIDRYLLVGTPERCARRLQEYLDAGARMVIFSPACPDVHVDEHLCLLAGEVVPAASAATVRR
ncbi:MAG: LLM class flavin-dependent oxidoreductase [Microbacteriaceae bacterium]